MLREREFGKRVVIVIIIIIITEWREGRLSERERRATTPGVSSYGLPIIISVYVYPSF